jgi:hypothetical protein
MRIMKTSSTEEALLVQLRQLPPDLVPVVKGLVDFLVRSGQERREREERESQERLRIQARIDGPLGRIWDNATDAAYDRL